jgi:hypothetical protein
LSVANTRRQRTSIKRSAIPDCQPNFTLEDDCQPNLTFFPDCQPNLTF